MRPGNAFTRRGLRLLPAFLCSMFGSCCLAFLPPLAAHDASRPTTPAKEGGPGTAPDSVATCRLDLALRDADTDAVLPGMVRAIRPDGTPAAIPQLLDRCLGLPRHYRELGWHVIPARDRVTRISLPAERLQIEALSGLEFTAASQAVDLSGREAATVEFPLKRFWSATDRGWIAGNTHLHLKDLDRKEADRYLREISGADGLSVVFVSYLERAMVDRSYTTNQHSRADLEALSSATLSFGNGEEYRHNFGGGGEGYGHVMFLDLPRRILPSSLGPGITRKGHDGIPLRPGILEARSQGATVVWCHNGFGFEDVPSWLGGLVDAQNIFDGGNQGSYADTFYRYLDVGLKVPFSTGTDWFLYDFSRVYVRPGGGQPLSAETWLAALKSGRSFITNGPLLEFEVDGHAPGATLEGKATHRVTLRVVGRDDFGTPELVVNGQVREDLDVEVTRHEAGWLEARGTMDLEIPAPGWIALRVAPGLETRNALDRSLFAHTSPIYLTAPDRPTRFDPRVARELIAEIESDLAAIASGGRFESEADLGRVRAHYEEAIDQLEARLDSLPSTTDAP